MIGYYILAVIALILIIIYIGAYRFHSTIFGKRFDVDPKVRYYTKEEFNLNSIDVEFNCGKEMLKGSIYSYDNPKTNRIIVYAHGMWSSTKAYIQDIEYLCRNGYLVFGFDYIGTDSSTGKSIGALSNGLKSLDYAIRFIKEKYKDYDIYLVGHSWGAHNSINVTKYHTDIKCVVAISPFVTLKRLLKGMIPKCLWWMTGFIKLVEFFKAGKYALSNSKKALKKFKGKSLVIHSKDDHMVNYKLNTYYLEKTCTSTSFLILDGHQHNPNYTKDAVIELANYLKKLRSLPVDEQDSFKEETNFHALGELDLNVMNKIVEFIEE